MADVTQDLVDHIGMASATWSFIAKTTGVGAVAAKCLGNQSYPAKD